MLRAKPKPCSCGCGRTGPPFTSRGKGREKKYYLNGHDPEKKRKPIAKRSKKKEDEIITSNAFYAERIAENIQRNGGVCKCDECKAIIPEPCGRNFCHFVSGGRLKAAYLDPENGAILGKGPIYKGKPTGECNCGPRYDEGTDRQSMNIYQESENRRSRIKSKHYSK